MPSSLKAVLRQRKGSEGRDRAFELSCIFANSANLLLSLIHMAERECLLSMGH